MVDKPFELGKTYHHTTGRKVTIIGIVQTHVYGVALVAEDDFGQLMPFGLRVEDSVNWEEIRE